MKMNFHQFPGWHCPLREFPRWEVKPDELRATDWPGAIEVLAIQRTRLPYDPVEAYAGSPAAPEGPTGNPIISTAIVALS